MASFCTSFENQSEKALEILGVTLVYHKSLFLRTKKYLGFVTDLSEAKKKKMLIKIKEKRKM